MSNQNTIPDFIDEPSSIGNALRAMKEVVESVVGQRPGTGVGVPRMFVQVQQPQAQAGLELKKGDLWINEGTGRMLFYDGRLWRSLVL